MINKENIETKHLLMSVIIILLVGTGLYFFVQKNRSGIFNENLSQLNNIYLSTENQKTNYSLRVIPIDSETTEGAELQVYFDKNNGTTKILEASYSGETFNEKYTYYFEDVSNFVLIERSQRWDRPFYIEERIQTKDETNKFYFKNIKMVVWVDSNNRSVSSRLSESQQKEQEILKQLDQFLQAVNQ